jgi:hypothetical protein
VTVTCIYKRAFGNSKILLPPVILPEGHRDGVRSEATKNLLYKREYNSTMRFFAPFGRSEPVKKWLKTLLKKKKS